MLAPTGQGSVVGDRGGFRVRFHDGHEAKRVEVEEDAR